MRNVCLFTRQVQIWRTREDLPVHGALPGIHQSAQFGAATLHHLWVPDATLRHGHPSLQTKQFGVLRMRVHNSRYFICAADQNRISCPEVPRRCSSLQCLTVLSRDRQVVHLFSVTPQGKVPTQKCNSCLCLPTRYPRKTPLGLAFCRRRRMNMESDTCCQLCSYHAVYTSTARVIATTNRCQIV